MFKGFLTIKFKDNYNMNAEVGSVINELNTSNAFNNVHLTRNFPAEKVILLDSCNCGIITATGFVASLDKILDDLYAFDSILNASVTDGVAGISLVVYSDESEIVRSFCYSVRGSRFKFASEVNFTELEECITKLLKDANVAFTISDLFDKQPNEVCNFLNSIFVGYDIYVRFYRGAVTRLTTLISAIKGR